jgi:predicted amidohydrolase
MSSESVRIACLQMNSGSEFTTNLTTFSAMARKAAERGAEFILSPEYFLMMDGSGRVMREAALDEQGEPAISALTALAREIQVWLLAGSITLKSGEGRMCNRSLLISAGGDVVAAYDKIHMFDATLPDGKVIRESSAYRPGERAVLAQTPWGTLGMTVCYDLRFPGLYRALAQAGAILITVPSSFQRQTGRAHWHALLRARAIENECFVLAPAMCGDHAGDRQSYGHSLVVDPWGEVVAEGGESPEIVYAEIDTRRAARIRGMIPSLDHDRPFVPPGGPG